MGEGQKNKLSEEERQERLAKLAELAKARQNLDNAVETLREAIEERDARLKVQLAAESKKTNDDSLVR